MATGLCEGFEEGSEEEILTAWQWLHDTKTAYQLQGWFGRAVRELLLNGVIEE